MIERFHTTGQCRKQLPLVVIPCSGKKLEGRHKAIDLYQGVGYKSIVTSSRVRRGLDYHLAFFSAKYGLVMADDKISDYEQKLSVDVAKAPPAKWTEEANSLMSRYDFKMIIACLPKVYLAAFKNMLQYVDKSLCIAEPEKGSGIGTQRQFLKKALNEIAPPSMHVRVFFGEGDKARMALLEVSRFDVIRPVLYRNGEGELIKSNPVEVTNIRKENGLQCIADENGELWSAHAVVQGLTEHELWLIEDYADTYDVSVNPRCVAKLSDIQHRIKVANSKKYQRVA